MIDLGIMKIGDILPLFIQVIPRKKKEQKENERKQLPRD
jgi:hypothetical protein